MPQVSAPPDERARKATTLVFQRLSPDGTQKNLAIACGVSDSTITRWKECVEPAMRLATQLGLKLVPVEMKCYAPADIEPYIQLAKQHMRRVKSADELLWEDDV